MGPYLEVLILNEVVENSQDIGYLLALELAFVTQREIHEQSCGIFQSVVAQSLQLVSDSLHNPLDHIKLDHLVLGFSSQGELLKSAKGVLSQVGVILSFLVERRDKDLDNVLSLQQVRPTEVLARQRIQETHRELPHLVHWREKQIVKHALLQL